MKTIVGIEALKKHYRTIKLQVGDHRGINAAKFAAKIGFDLNRVMFDRMDNRFGREVQFYVNETFRTCYSMDDLLEAVKDLDTCTIDAMGREWLNKQHTNAKDRSFDTILWQKGSTMTKEKNERKARHARHKDVPVAAPVKVIFEGRRNFMADPATDAQRFEQVCREADIEAKKTGDNIIVFKNREGNYFTWEEKYSKDPNSPMEALYTAQPPAKEDK